MLYGILPPSQTTLLIHPHTTLTETQEWWILNWITRWTHDIVGWAWVSARAEHGPVAWLSSECDWTSHHRAKKYTRVQHRNCESGLTGWSSTHCRSCGYSLDRWKHSSHLLWHALPVAPPSL